MAQVYNRVYTSYVQQLVKCLPMNDQLFVTELSANSLLPGNMEATIASLPTPVNKSSQFLSNVIKPALDNDYTDSFDKLLVIMEGCGYPHVQALAAEIKTEITKSQKMGNWSSSKMLEETSQGSGNASTTTEKPQGLDSTDSATEKPQEKSNASVPEERIGIKIGTTQKSKNLWTENELEAKLYESEEDKALPKEIKEKVLKSVIVLLVVVNRKENFAIRCYLKPLDDHSNVYLYTQREKHGDHIEHAVYIIGKYGACPAAVRIIPCFAKKNGGQSIVSMMAYSCFPNLGAIIGVGAACGVENKVQMCDILVSRNIILYNEAKYLKGAEAITISASTFLSELFQHVVRWPNIAINSRLEDNGMERPKIEYGEVLCGPYLIDEIKIKKELIQKIASEIIGIEIEGAHLFATSQATNAHTIIVKAVCDFGDGKTKEEFRMTAALLSADCVNKVLDNPQLPDVLFDNKVSSSIDKLMEPFESSADKITFDEEAVIPEGKSPRDKPSIQDMLTHARQFAIFWKEIGEMLKLEAYELKIIEMDNAYHPHKTKQCFRVMLEEWLKQGYLPTWEKFCNAIKEAQELSPAVGSCSAGPARTRKQVVAERAKKAFDTYYEKLIKSLPMENETFMDMLGSFCSDDLIANLKAQLTRSTQAIIFLENAIEVPLEDEDIKPFKMLLSAMKDFGTMSNIQLQMLAKEIQQSIFESSDENSTNIQNPLSVD